MTRYDLLRLLLLPSLSSGIVITLLTIAVLLFQAWSYIDHNQLFYESLFGPHGISTALVNAPDALVLARQALNSTAAYYIALLVGAAIIGAAVYELLEVGESLANKRLTLDATTELSALKEKLTRLGVRACSLVAWAIYILFWIAIFMPFVSLLLQTGIDTLNIGDVAGWVQLCLAAVSLWAGLHLHSIFLRLSWLKPRLFGGWDVELASE